MGPGPWKWTQINQTSKKIRMMKEENRRIEEEKLVEKRLNKGMKVEIDTKKEETRLTNPERQMKHENRLSLFLTHSHGQIIDFQKIEEELGCTLVRGKAYNSATWPFSKFLEKTKTCARRQDEGTIY